MSTCPEPARAVTGRERQVRRNGWPRKPFSWGTVEQAVHSRPEKAEELLFHGKISGAVALTQAAAPFLLKGWVADTVFI